MVSGAGNREGWEVTTNGNRVSSWADENVMEVNSGDGGTML